MGDLAFFNRITHEVLCSLRLLLGGYGFPEHCFSSFLLFFFAASSTLLNNCPVDIYEMLNPQTIPFYKVALAIV